MTETLLKTPLHALHVELGGRMVPFAGYDMPVQFEGIVAEHTHTRTAAGLFDVSHMGQARVRGDEKTLEVLISADLSTLGAGEQRYTLLLNDKGGIMDDLMVSRPFGADGDIFLVVNAACKANDFAHMEKHFAGKAELDVLEDRALLALQGPQARAVMSDIHPEAAALTFMQCGVFNIDGVEMFVSCSGYTGEDGYEISVPASQAEAFARKLLSDSRVKPIGLGARDSLRLEAGLCLYGHDMNEETTPMEATLTWAVAKSRREAGDLQGWDVMSQHLSDGAPRKRVGLKLEGRAPAREGMEIVAEGEHVGVITSGGYGPSAEAAIAMGYVRADLAKAGTPVTILVRGKEKPAEVVKMPFVEHRFYRG